MLGITDAAVRALAEAGCGAQLTSLTLFSASSLFLFFLVAALASHKRASAELKNITDAAVQALAGAGCGARLTTLDLRGAFSLPFCSLSLCALLT